MANTPADSNVSDSGPPMIMDVVDEPLPSGLRTTTEHPYRILLVGDFAGGPAGRISGALSGGCVPVTSATLDQVMLDARPTVQLRLSDPCMPGNVLVTQECEFSSIRSFNPAQILANIDATRGLQALRAAVADRLNGKTPEAALARQVSDLCLNHPNVAALVTAATPAAGPATTAPSPANLASTFDLGDGGDGHATDLARSIASNASRPSSLSAGEAAAAHGMQAAVDAALNQWTTAVLHDSSVQAVESIWRTTQQLLRMCNDYKPPRFSILHAAHDDIPNRFRALVIEQVFDAGLPSPDLVVLLDSFSNSAPDMALLDQLAQEAASLPVVVLAHGGPGLLGVKSAWQVATLPAIGQLFTQYPFAKWNALRKQSYAAAIAMVFGRFMVRPCHAVTATADSPAYMEPCKTEKDITWGCSTALVAFAIARSVAEHGWPTICSGLAGGRVEDLPFAVGGKDGKTRIGPSDTNLPMDRVTEFAAGGVNIVTGRANGDDVFFANALVAAHPTSADLGAINRVSLPYQLFATRLSNLLLELRTKLSDTAPAAARQAVEEHLADWLRISGDAGAFIKVQAESADNGKTRVGVTVRPPPNVLPSQGNEVSIGLEL